MSSPIKSSLAGRKDPASPKVNSARFRSVSYSDNDEDSAHADRKKGHNAENENYNEGEGFENEGSAPPKTTAGHTSPSNADILSDGTKEFRAGISIGLENIFDKLRDNLNDMERQAKASSIKVMEKDSLSFLRKQDKNSVEKLKARQERELQRINSAYQISVRANESRKRAIMQQVSLNTTAENNDITIQEQEVAQNISSELKELLDDHRSAFEQYLRQMERQHTKARKQLSAAQDRKIQDKKTLVELETSNMSEEKRLNRMKTFQFKMNHQKSRDKKVGEHLRAAQALEIKQAKERFELEIRFLEEMELLKARNSQRLLRATDDQRCEMQKAEVEIKELEFSLRATTHAMEHHNQYSKLLSRHRTEQKLMLEQQAERQDVRKKRWAQKLAKVERSAIDSNGELPMLDPPEDLGICSMAFGLSNSNAEEEDQSAAASEHSKAEVESEGSSSNTRTSNSDAGAGANYASQDPQRLKEQLNRAEHDLKLLVSRHSKQIVNMRKKLNAEYRTREELVRTSLKDLAEEHLQNILGMEKQQITELVFIKNTQEKESLMEENILNSEHNMLLERKRLNLMFQTVVDGIITINPKGVIQRFNTSAETMFGYSASEVVGKNIKMLQPEFVAKNHDEYLKTYLDTGIRRVIGVGRSTTGKRKDETFFPLHLSLSEVKSEGVHIFTAVIRNLTKEHEQQEIAEKESKKKKDLMQSLIQELATERGRCSDLIHSMLPPVIAQRMLAGETIMPERFSESTVLFTEICGFAELSTSYSALDIVDLLNDLYCVFDEVVLLYDVYKVETIGDSYVCVSGVPKKNNTHAQEIAKLALHFQQAIKYVRMRKFPEFELKLKVGIHSGPLVAGIVGCKNPRYCLFGDTVNTASRMKSTAEPKSVHLSSTTHKLLLQTEGAPHQLVSRGEVQVKGKGSMQTYWLDSIKGYEPDLTALKQMNILKNVPNSRNTSLLDLARMSSENLMSRPQRNAPS